MKTQTQIDLELMIVSSIRVVLMRDRPAHISMEWLETNKNYRAIEGADCLGDAVWYAHQAMEDMEMDDGIFLADAIVSVVDNWAEII